MQSIIYVYDVWNILYDIYVHLLTVYDVWNILYDICSFININVNYIDLVMFVFNDECLCKINFYVFNDLHCILHIVWNIVVILFGYC